jgi:hypothetical protein
MSPMRSRSVLTVQVNIKTCINNFFAPFIGVGYSSTPDGITVVEICRC